MAKTCMINRNKKRERLYAKHAEKRAALKAVVSDKKTPLEEKMEASAKLAKLPRNSARNRIHHACELTGRSHGFYRKLKISRIQLRKLANEAQIPGMKKSSW